MSCAIRTVGIGRVCGLMMWVNRTGCIVWLPARTETTVEIYECRQEFLG